MEFNSVSILKSKIDNLPPIAGADLHMEDLLEPALCALPELLLDKSKWSSLYIDYEPPFLMRLSTALKGEETDKQIYLSTHYFFAAPQYPQPTDHAGIVNPYKNRPELFLKESVNNYHPHPWAAGFYILQGGYKQQVGLAQAFGYNSDPASPLRPVPHTVWTQDAENPEKNKYAFNNPLIWHRVLPNDGSFVTTLMVTYKPLNWQQVGPKPGQVQRKLSTEEEDFMFSHFKELLSQRLKPKSHPLQQPQF